MTWWIFLICLPILWALWTVLHESMHALGAKFYGYKILSFKPYPHKVEDQLYWGRVTFEGENQILISLMPYIWDLLVVVSVGVGLFLVADPHWYAVLLALYVAPVVNTGSAIQARYRKSYGDLAQLTGEALHMRILTVLVLWLFLVAVIGGTLGAARLLYSGGV